jgi:hypothetical protein
MILIAKPSSYSKEQLTMEKTKMTNKLSANNRNSIGRFVEGSSGNPNGRRVGSKNKFTTLKNAFIETFEELGGVDNLVEWAKANQTEFYRMLARLMPREIKADVNTAYSLVECLREIDEREANAKE